MAERHDEHRRGESDFLGPGDHEEFWSEGTRGWREALLLEAEGAVGGWERLGATKVRGGPFPGKRMYPREVQEVQRLVGFRKAGVLRQRLVALRAGSREEAVAASLVKTFEHLREVCWACKIEGHRRGDPACGRNKGKKAATPPVQRSIEKEKKTKIKKKKKNNAADKHRKFNKSEKGKKRHKDYRGTTKGKKVRADARSKYADTPKGKKKHADARRAWKDRQREKSHSKVTRNLWNLNLVLRRILLRRNPVAKNPATNL